MSISSISSMITRLQKELSDIAVKVSQEIKKEVSLYSRINQIHFAHWDGLKPAP